MADQPTITLTASADATFDNAYVAHPSYALDASAFLSYAGEGDIVHAPDISAIGRAWVKQSLVVASFGAGDGPTGSVHEWVVPQTREYIIEATGAQGGMGNGSGIGGLGTRVTGTFALNEGDVIKVIVGHEGTSTGDKHAGGGGATAVWKDGETAPMLVAGGGGGYGVGSGTNQQSVAHAHLETHGKDGYGGTSAGDGGTDGGPGGPGSTRGAGGAGWSGDQDQLGNAVALINGGKGDEASFADGGFGAGGGSHNSTSWGSCGGGGGYSGGGGAYASSSSNEGAGGGGGSFNAATIDSENEAEVGFGNGDVTITTTQADQPVISLDSVADIALDLEGLAEQPSLSLSALADFSFDNTVSYQPFVTLDAIATSTVAFAVYVDTFGFADIAFYTSIRTEVETDPTEVPEHLEIKPIERVSFIMPEPTEFDEFGRPT